MDTEVASPAASDSAASADSPTSDVTGRTILLAGGTSTAGITAAVAVARAGAQVIVAGRDPEKLARVVSAAPSALTVATDLTDEAAVTELVRQVHGEVGAIDGVLHLVGGWRGGGGLAGQTDDDYRFLERSLTALRFVSRAFAADLGASPAGRLAIVSSTAVAHPLAGGANYAAVKAAGEAWTRAVGQGFEKTARDEGRELSAAAVIFRVKSLAGLEGALADAFIALWADDASDWNDVIVELGEAEGNPAR
ncbi:SDR family NAD(P)-dependent oxidoreductase [Microbacterium sp. P07]|uniref:SDR family NAD(P)-dependent oxidoreductase n=1 Tax=Microbacterium sp. P07 TaxID=3366952 RepID=UPI003745D63C